MKIENVHTYGWADAIRSMRNPLNSWNRIDSKTECDPVYGSTTNLEIGENDAKLIKALTIGGHPHRKFLRQIFVTFDITMPSYVWAEFDTYKVSTVRNSCSFQHKGTAKEFELSDFTIDDNHKENEIYEDIFIELDNHWDNTISIINKLRDKYNETKDYKYFRAIRQILPSGYNYKATWSGNYESLLNMYFWRHEHKLIEWHEFCDIMLEKIPYLKELITLDKST